MVRVPILVAVVFATMLYAASPTGLGADSAVNTSGSVNAVLFYKTDCRDCVPKLLPFLGDLKKLHEDTLRVLAVNNSDPAGGDLYLKALFSGALEADTKLPVLLVGKIVISGTDEIIIQFPKLIDKHLASGGLGWAEIDGLSSALNSAAQQPGSGTPYWVSAESGGLLSLLIDQALRNYKKDITGNSAALVVLAGMVLAWIKSLHTIVKRTNINTAEKRLWLSPVLMVIGSIAAGYLLITGIFQSEAACGPVGDCNAVQESEYAKLFGLVPVSLLGVLSYLGILFLWFFYMISKSGLRFYAILAAWAISLFGVSFFIYLTFLEPFVIGATCAWCLTSAVAMTAQLLILNKPAGHAWFRITRKQR